MTSAEQECRRQFEEWAKSANYELSPGYYNQAARDGWQACAAACRQPVPSGLAEKLRDAAHVLPGFNDEMVRLSDALALLSASQHSAPAGSVSLEEKHPQETGVLPDWMRVKNAMKLVWKHKCKGAYNLCDKTWDILAETAAKTMWLIEEENERKNKP